MAFQVSLQTSIGADFNWLSPEDTKQIYPQELAAEKYKWQLDQVKKAGPGTIVVLDIYNPGFDGKRSGVKETHDWIRKQGKYVITVPIGFKCDNQTYNRGGFYEFKVTNDGLFEYIPHISPVTTSSPNEYVNPNRPLVPDPRTVRPINNGPSTGIFDGSKSSYNSPVFRSYSTNFSNNACST